MSKTDPEQAQLERANQAWVLLVHDSPTPEVLAALRRILRVKRSELPEFAASLPGPIRRGARVDLGPLEVALVKAGVHCELRRSTA